MYSRYPGMGGGLTKSSGARADRLLAALKSRVAKLPRNKEDLRATIDKLPPDEKALALIGIPLPGGIALPIAWRGAKNLAKKGIPGSSKRNLSDAIRALRWRRSRVSRKRCWLLCGMSLKR